MEARRTLPLRRPPRPYKLAKVSYTHDAMIDLIIANPSISQNEIAAHFGYTPTWVSIIFNSDAFLERLAERKAELVDPAIVATIEEKVRAVAGRSLELLLEKLHSPNVSEKFILGAVELSTRALGYGARNSAPVVNNYVAVVPQPAKSVEEWTAKYAPHGERPQDPRCHEEAVRA